MTSLFTHAVTEPLYNMLVAVYTMIPLHDFGIAIIVTTVFIKIVLFGVSRQQISSQKKMQELQPEMKKIQEKYKDDKEQQTKEIFALYKKHKTTPFSGCLPIIIQLVIFIGFYHILLKMTGDNVIVDSALLYTFIPNPDVVIPYFFGMNLGHPSPILALLAASAQYWQMKVMMNHKKDISPKISKKDRTKPDMQDFAQIMSKQMLYIGPVLTLVIGMSFPGGLALYWFISTLFTAVQQQIMFTHEEHK